MLSSITPAFPTVRKRRLRENPTLRHLVRETHLVASQLILPLFIVPGENIRQAIPSLPAVFRLSADQAAAEASRAWQVGIKAVILFGVPTKKDQDGSQATDPQGLIPQAIKIIKKQLPELVVITDVCLCQWLSHGHCGLVKQKQILNDATLPILNRIAFAHAQAGADIVAPSDMMDGRVAAMRKYLDDHAASHIPIMAYSAKFASAFYGPFRVAAKGAPQFGDRASYQMDFANAQEALHEVLLDVAEGADIVLIKPALPCLDIIRSVREKVLIPVGAYQVSGEYAMLWAAAEKGWLDLDKVMMESLVAINRAGANLILTYFAIRAAELLQKRVTAKKKPCT